MPDLPQMSAFSFPGEEETPPPSGPFDAPPSSVSAPLPSVPGGGPPVSSRGLPEPSAGPSSPSAKKAPLPIPTPTPSPAAVAPAAAAPAAAAPAAAAPADEDPDEEWQVIYKDFVAAKEKCGEKTDGFTYEKFKQTLRKNRDAIVRRHKVKRVKFSVYEKQGKAALKASPIKS